MPTETFGSIITDVGTAQLSNAMALGQVVNITDIAVGDGDLGAYYTPTVAQTSLKNEMYRGTINNRYIHPQNPNVVVFELAIPVATGPFTLREVGVFDSAGNMISVSKIPETYKTTTAQGASTDLLIKYELVTTNTAQLNLLVDPSVVLASHQKVADDIATHSAATNPHPTYTVPQATETLIGKVELASVPEAKTGTDTARAVTPAGLGAALAGERKTALLERLLTAMQGSTTNPAMDARPETYADLTGIWIDEIEVSPSNMTSDVLPAPFVASASAAYGPQPASKLFDGGVVAALNTGLAPSWWKIDLGLGNAAVVTKYQINLLPAVRNPTAWNLEGSNDDINWTVLDTQSGIANGSLTTATFVNAIAYRYYRLYATAGGDGTYIGEINELDLFVVGTGGSVGFAHDAAGAFLHNRGGYGPDLIDSTQTYTADDVTSGAASNAADGNLATSWSTANAPTHWWAVQFAVAQTITKWKIYINGPATYVTEIKFEGSNDGLTWTLIDTWINNFTPTGWFERAVTNSTAYTHYRLFQTLSGSGNGGLMDVQMMEDAPATNMTIISTALPAFAEPTRGYLLGLWEPVDLVTYDLDVTGELSKNDGVTWENTAVAKIGEAIVDVGGAPTVVDVVFGEIIFVTAGAQVMRSQLKGLNAKHIKFHGTIVDVE